MIARQHSPPCQTSRVPQTSTTKLLGHQYCDELLPFCSAHASCMEMPVGTARQEGENEPPLLGFDGIIDSIIIVIIKINLVGNRARCSKACGDVDDGNRLCSALPRDLLEPGWYHRQAISRSTARLWPLRSLSWISKLANSFFIVWKRTETKVIPSNQVLRS